MDIWELMGSASPWRSTCRSMHCKHWFFNITVIAKISFNNTLIIWNPTSYKILQPRGRNAISFACMSWSDKQHVWLSYVFTHNTHTYFMFIHYFYSVKIISYELYWHCTPSVPAGFFTSMLADALIKLLK